MNFVTEEVGTACDRHKEYLCCGFQPREELRMSVRQFHEKGVVCTGELHEE